MRQQATELIV